MQPLVKWLAESAVVGETIGLFEFVGTPFPALAESARSAKIYCVAAGWRSSLINAVVGNGLLISFQTVVSSMSFTLGSRACKLSSRWNLSFISRS